MLIYKSEHFMPLYLVEFYSSLKEGTFFTLEKAHIEDVGSDWIDMHVAKAFSVMKFNKSISSLSHDHLWAVFQRSSSDIQPDFRAVDQTHNW